MNTVLLVCGVLLAIICAAVVGLMLHAWALRSGKVKFFANLFEGVHEGGNVSYYADAALTTRYLLVKRGSGATKVAICGASDVPLGVATDEVATADLADQPVNVAVLCGGSQETMRMVASDVITQDALVVPAANGKIAALSATPGTYKVVGKALTAAGADGDLIEVAPMYWHVVVT